MSCYDLHSHSWVSDGTLSPADLVRRAAAAGVDVLALTDHDDTDGCEEALRTAPQVGIAVVPGVELSVTWQATTIHVGGLQLDPSAPALAAGAVVTKDVPANAVAGGIPAKVLRMRDAPRDLHWPRPVEPADD